jgi:uncharacterized protein YcfJ
MCLKSCRSLKITFVLLMSASLVGCESKAGTGALVGGAGGAAAGGIIGSLSHGRAGEGALIGGAIGAIGGGLIGHSMDENDKKDPDYDRRHNGNASWHESDPVTKSDVITWTNQGVRNDIIIDRINRSGVASDLTAADQNDLRNQGVSESVIRAMKDEARR